jgi:hypothetical protein
MPENHKDNRLRRWEETRDRLKREQKERQIRSREKETRVDRRVEHIEGIIDLLKKHQR